MTLVGLELGLMCLWQGDFIEAQANSVKSLSFTIPSGIVKPGSASASRIPARPARAYLAITKWLLGEVGRARALFQTRRTSR